MVIRSEVVGHVVIAMKEQYVDKKLGWAINPGTTPPPQ